MFHTFTFHLGRSRHPVNVSSKDSFQDKHILIGGNDEFAVKNHAAEAARSLAPADAMNFEMVNGCVENEEIALRQLASAREALQTLPFFGGRKVVHLKDVNFLGDDALGRNAQIIASLEKLVEILSSLPAASAQCIISAVGVDKRRVFFKAFSKFGHVESFDKVDLSRERDFGAWVDEVEERMAAEGLQADPLVVERLVELVGNDSRALQGEIEKIKLYIHPRTKAEENDLRAIASESRAMVVWDLCDAVTLGKTTEAVRLLKKLLAQKETEVGILILLSNHIRLAALTNHLK
ncbi:MAG: DNA polymerase III subunit delta [bacterium]